MPTFLENASKNMVRLARITNE